MFIHICNACQVTSCYIYNIYWLCVIYIIYRSIYIIYQNYEVFIVWETGFTCHPSVCDAVIMTVIKWHFSRLGNNAHQLTMR